VAIRIVVDGPDAVELEGVVRAALGSRRRAGSSSSSRSGPGGESAARLAPRPLRGLELLRPAAGADGVDAFTRVFRTEARTVVVLHRTRWGQTKWTRVEENAIKSRGFESTDGFDFLIMAPLDKLLRTPSLVSDSAALS
jgi:hypothetical protein